ncbi:MAG TPA: nucleoid occlusion protein [Clostridia bacterium]|nr:nucleoid occlusion protein [Clostridia bacterium]
MNQMDLKQAEVNIVYLRMDSIKPNPYQPRKQFGNTSLDELSASIKQYGVMQPITVREIAYDKYEVIAGERRLRASRMAGLSQIPTIIVEADDNKAAILALLENLQREDLSYMEEAEGYCNLIKEHGFTQEELAQKIGKSQSTIANKIRLLKLSPIIKKILSDNELSERHARALLKLSSEQLQLKVIKIVLERSFNVKRTEELVEAAIRKISLSEQRASNENPRVTRVIKDMRIFINTIRQSVELMKISGINAKATQIDRGDYMEFIVRVPKKPNTNLIQRNA